MINFLQCIIFEPFSYSEFILVIDLICLYCLKSFVEFEYCAKKAISGSYGVENSRKFLKKAKKFGFFALKLNHFNFIASHVSCN